ncbi:unnamed protein product, partial [Nesidiocoris tenuis]
MTHWTISVIILRYTYPKSRRMFFKARRAQISFGNTVQTSVRLLPGRVGANPSILTFVVSWRDDYNGRSEVRKKAYFYVGTQVDTSEFQVQGGAIGLDTFEIWN